MFEDGGLQGFWLRVKNKALEWFQKWIQKKLGGTIVGVEQRRLNIGDILLASSRSFSHPYIAKVQALLDDKVMVRYIDYRHSSGWLDKTKLAPWINLLNIELHQSARCRLK